MTGIAERLKALRERCGRTPAEVEDILSIGSGWIDLYEAGDDTLPRVDVLLTLCKLYEADPFELFSSLTTENAASLLRRPIRAATASDGIDLHFSYGKHDARYHVPGATIEQFETVEAMLRAGLGRQVGARSEEQQRAIKTQAVADAFWLAVQLWPDVNPTDIWGFVIARAYCDPLNHPADYARLDLGQSWKRTLGWALEKALVKHYGDFLAAHDVSIEIPPRPRKAQLLAAIATNVRARLEADKVDVFLVGSRDGKEFPFGVVHVKNSFAERRTDDVAMSEALVKAGFLSPLWTMDCKAWPSATPRHSGELGDPLPLERRTAKRKDIEEDRYFSACFSYNENTVPTPPESPAKAQVIVCDFRNPDDAFSAFVVDFWRGFTPKRARSVPIQ